MDKLLIEAARLYRLGFAIHWLRSKSKIPLESGWTRGPRKEWKDLKATYRPGLNVGVRLGRASEICDGFLTKGFLAVIDVDVKSDDPGHRKEAVTAARLLLRGKTAPLVRSGRGNGSRHYYCVTAEPFKTFNAAQSSDEVKAFIPSRRPSKRELRELTKDELDRGLRFSPAWEISLYSDGRQVVLPPSIHPDTGKTYQWGTELVTAAELPLLDFVHPVASGSGKPPAGALPDWAGDRGEPPAFTPVPVELDWVEISSEVKAGIVSGAGITDRSAFLLRAVSALFSAGLSRNEVLSVLTDKANWISSAAYDRRGAHSRQKAADWIYQYSVAQIERERAASVFATVDYAGSAKLTPEEKAAQDNELEKERPWTQDIIRTKTGQPSSCVQNVVRILTHKVSTDVIRRDLFSFRDTYTVDTPWGGLKGKALENDDVPKIKYWLGITFGFEPSSNVIEDALIVLACQNAYDPVREALDVLPKWDEKKRLDTWLRDNFEARGCDEYLAQVFRKWMVAMVMRIYDPGAKFDWMPIFEGAQGVGKSSFGRLLVGDKYFLDWLPNLHEKDAALSLQGMWGVELGELSQFRRNELENIKAFLTRTIDKVRPPYGRRLIESSRRCVFFGTTNRKTYLIDETGNRRFKPVIVGNLNFKALKKDRDQLFAEAKWIFENTQEKGSALELTGRAQAFEREIHQEKMVEDDSHSMEESMRDFLGKVIEEKFNFDLDRFTILDLFSGVGPLAFWRKENRNFQLCGKMLKRIGAKDRIIRGRKYWRLAQNENNSAIFRPPTNHDFF